jgi:hypothetical protein
MCQSVVPYANTSRVKNTGRLASIINLGLECTAALSQRGCKGRKQKNCLYPYVYGNGCIVANYTIWHVAMLFPHHKYTIYAPQKNIEAPRDHG